MNLSEILAIQYQTKINQTVIFLAGNRKEYRSEKPIELLSLLCLNHGCTLEGRIDAIRQTMGYKQKPPVYIGGSEGTFVFSDTSYTDNEECVWLFENRILSIVNHSHGGTKVVFQSGDVLEFPMKKVIIQRQMNRCEAYRQYLLQKDGTL